MSMIDVTKEQMRQVDLWGTQDHDDEWYLPIMIEEVGEIAKAMVEHRFQGASIDDIRKELVEAVAVGMSWIECIDRRAMSEPERERKDNLDNWIEGLTGDDR